MKNSSLVGRSSAPIPSAAFGRTASVASSESGYSQSTTTTANLAATGGLAAAGGSGGGGGIVTEQEFRDTVLYLQQQQSLHHQEMMEAMKQIALSVKESTHRASSPVGRGSNGRDAEAGASKEKEWRVESNNYISKREASPQTIMLGAAHSASRAAHGDFPSVPPPGSSRMEHTAIELRAAKARIEQLEATVGRLQDLVEQKEETIRRLTQATITSVSQGVDASLSRSRSLVGGMATHNSSAMLSLTSPSSMRNHEASIDKLITQLSVGTSTSATRNALSEHQQRCQQILLQKDS